MQLRRMIVDGPMFAFRVGMKKLTLASMVFTGLVIGTATGFVVAQDKYKKRAHSGPYRVLISKPIIGLSYTAGSLFREHEYLSAMFNEIHKTGLTPVHTNIMTQTLGDREDEERLVVVCIKP